MENKEYIYDVLKQLNINYEMINHKAIFSENDTDSNQFDTSITIGKNLFLRNDKKTNYYLLNLPLNKKANLKGLAQVLNEKKLCFANEEELKKYLEITPGSVSYLNVITASKISNEFKNVTYLIDRELMNSKTIGFHPSDNTATVVTDSKAILKVYDKYNLNYLILDI